MILRTIAIALAALFLTTAAYAQQGTREITKIAGDLYRFKTASTSASFSSRPTASSPPIRSTRPRRPAEG